MARLSGPHLKRFVSAIFVAILFGGTAGRAAWSQEQPGLAELRAYVAKDPERASLIEFALGAKRQFSGDCTNPSAEPSALVEILSPIEFRDGAPVNGVWMQRINVQGCKWSKFLNTLSLAQNGAIRRAETAPGMTAADPFLQRDLGVQVLPFAVALVVAARGKKGDECTTFRVVDTEIVGVTGPPVANALQPGARPFREIWTALTKCDDVVKIPVDFVPNSTGTGMNVHSDDLRKLNAF